LKFEIRLAGGLARRAEQRPIFANTAGKPAG
jgi:hypothetical protein